MRKNTSIMDFCFFRDAIVSREKACISVASHSLQYASMCFTGIRGYIREGKRWIFRLKDHHERLMNGSKILGFGFYIPYKDFEEIIASVVEANSPKSDFYIRAFLFSEDEVLGVCYENLKFNLGIYIMHLSDYYQRNKGLKLMVSSWEKISDAAIPTKTKVVGSYVNSSLATTDARRSGYDEALLMGNNHNIVEASVANLFIVYRGRVITPPLGEDMLEGITWMTVIELLKEQGYTVHYEAISRSMIYICDELFLTGTAAQVVFAESVDGKMIGNGKEGPITKIVRNQFQNLIEMKHSKSKEYLIELTKKSSA